MSFVSPEDRLAELGGTKLHYDGEADQGSRDNNRSAIRKQPASDDGDLQLIWFDEIEPCLDALDFVQGVLVERSAAVVYGESNTGKTFWALDLALHTAAGKEWFGRRVEQGGVVYCVLEGSLGFRNRVTAWRKAHVGPGQDVPFAAIQSPLNLLDPEADTGRLIQAIQQASQRIPVPVKLVVVDTLSRALAGGNENAPDDMGALVANMDRIREETGACVLFIHHSGKDAAKGARGHSSLRAAIDTEIEVVATADGLKTATIVKQRELQKGGVLQFRLDVVEIGRNRHSEVVSTCIVSPSDEEGVAQPTRKRLGKTSQIGMDMLRRALTEHGQHLPDTSDYPANTRAVTVQQWRDAFYAGIASDNPNTQRTEFNRARNDLLSSKVITSLNSFVWFVGRGDE